MKVFCNWQVIHGLRAVWDTFGARTRPWDLCQSLRRAWLRAQPLRVHSRALGSSRGSSYSRRQGVQGCWI